MGDAKTSRIKDEEENHFVKPPMLMYSTNHLRRIQEGRVYWIPDGTA
jgi:hypothetical protein